MADNQLDILAQAGFQSNELQSYASNQINDLAAAGFNTNEIQSYAGIKELDTNPIKQYWNDIVTQVKGEGEFDIQKHIERGVGKSLFSVAKAYSEGTGLPQAFAPIDPKDSGGYLGGIVERASTIAADFPAYYSTFKVSSKVAPTAAGKIAATFLTGAITPAVKSMYIDALQRGETNSWLDWYRSFIDIGLKTGIEEGAKLTAAAYAPGLLGYTGAGGVAAQVAAYEGVGAAINGELPSKDDLIYSTALFGLFGIGEAGISKSLNAIKKQNLTITDVVESSVKDPSIKEDLVSKNNEQIRSYQTVEDKKAIEINQQPKPDIIEEVKTLQSELNSLNNENLSGSIIEKYSYYANKDAGQNIGNREVIVKLNNDYYNKYIKNLSNDIFQIEGDKNFYTYVDKQLIKINKDFINLSKIPFEELQNKNIYLKLSSVDNKPFSINEINTLENIRPKSEYALQVYNFNNKESINRRSSSDSNRTPEQIEIDKKNLKTRNSGKSNLEKIGRAHV